MKHALIFINLMLCLKNFSQPAQITIKDPDAFGAIILDYDWSDEFDGNVLDTSVWCSTYPWQSRWLIGTHEQEYMRDENVKIDNGTLKLNLKKEPGKYRINPWETDSTLYTANGIDFLNLRDFVYTSGVISSKKRYSYGYYELKFKINIAPQALNIQPYLTSHVPGIWPAFWFRGDNSQKNGEFEIDAFEIQTQCPERFYAGVHSTNPHLDNSNPHLLPADYANNYVKIGVLWTPKRIIWIYDKDGDADFFAPTAANRAFFKVDAPLNIILSLAMGDVPINSSNFCELQTGPTEQTDNSLPVSFEIDYLRHYKYQEHQVFVYPNPFSTMLYFNAIDFEFKSIIINNIFGVEVFSIQQNLKSINLEFLEDGIYFITFTNGEEKKVRKIVKHN